jgi:ubiquitin-protein ligase
MSKSEVGATVHTPLLTNVHRFSPPTLQFLTPVYHPLVGLDGTIADLYQASEWNEGCTWISSAVEKVMKEIKGNGTFFYESKIKNAEAAMLFKAGGTGYTKRSKEFHK